MKVLIAALLVSFSFQSFAYESSVIVSFVSYVSTADMSGNNPFLKAQEIIKDTNEYNLSGDVSPALAEHIRNAQEENLDLSQTEAIDQLTEQAQLIINENN